MTLQQPELFICGKRFFERLAEAIRTAKATIVVNMFIWRNDEIGAALAQRLLEAADRGVRISICKDRYGVLLECCEENCASFFHARRTIGEKMQSFCLKHLYRLAIPSPAVPQNIEGRLRRHPNIQLDDGQYRRDHSKFWIFDDETLYLGGINVEDKETIYRRYPIDSADKSLLPFASDSAGNLFVIKDGGIWLWNHENDSTVFVASSFTAFLELLHE